MDTQRQDNHFEHQPAVIGSLLALYVLEESFAVQSLSRNNRFQIRKHVLHLRFGLGAHQEASCKLTAMGVFFVGSLKHGTGLGFARCQLSYLRTAISQNTFSVIINSLEQRARCRATCVAEETFFSPVRPPITPSIDQDAGFLGLNPQCPISHGLSSLQAHGMQQAQQQEAHLAFPTSVRKSHPHLRCVINFTASSSGVHRRVVSRRQECH